MNIIILTFNKEKYTQGYYYQDLINAFKKKANCYLYGPGYPDYNNKDTLDDVIAKSPFNKNLIDLIIVSNSWEIEDERIPDFDPHPKINLSKINNIPKVFFINKEYKKFEKKIEYARNNKFDIVCTVHPFAEKWKEKTGINFFLLPFGISLERFLNLNLKKEIDFAFTGNLHKKYLNTRYLVKQKLFKKKYWNIKSNKGREIFLKGNPIRDEYKKYNIFWAEWGSKNLLGRSLLPNGKKYVEFLNKTKVFFNTPSALGIFNTRFLELMATKSLIFCPESEYYLGILKNYNNCIMFKNDLSDFEEKFIEAIENVSLRNKIIDNAFEEVKKHTYEKRIETLLNKIFKNVT